MQLSTAVRPISAVKVHLTEIIRTFSEEAAPPVVITQNGEAKAVLMGIHEYERMQETLAILKALSISGKSFEADKGRPAREIFAGLHAPGETMSLSSGTRHTQALFAIFTPIQKPMLSRSKQIRFWAS